MCSSFAVKTGNSETFNVAYSTLYLKIAVSRLPNGENSTIDDVNTFFSEHPVTVLAQRETPITTLLSDEELAAYRALHTYDGTTVVSTAEDVAGIEVRYVAEGEKYIDRKISEAIASAAETKLAAYDTLSGAIHEGVNEA